MGHTADGQSFLVRPEVMRPSFSGIPAVTFRRYEKGKDPFYWERVDIIEWSFIPPG